MPLTGPHGEKGKILAELIKIGLEDKLNGFVTTNTYDVSTEEFAEQAAKKLLARNTEIILGPLFTPSIRSFEKIVKNNNIIMISLSNNPLVTDESNIYIFGHSPLKQTYRMIEYLTNKDFKEFALLLPKNRNSDNISKVLKELIESNGGSIIANQQYTNEVQSINEEIQKISELVDQAIEDIDNNAKPVLFITEDNESTLRIIFESIKKHNLDTKAIIAGDSRIDTATDIDIKLIFTGSRHVLSSTSLEKIQNQLAIHHLNYLENLAYDLGAMTSTAIGLSYTRETFLNKLQSPVWYHGVSGNLRFNKYIAERKYSIIERSGKNYNVLDNAQESPKN